ncbi:MAG: type I-E CRISPR-associated protein Cas6/Cse3/CasE, partial [Chloroflexales bacterium]|nr:type I-E CRISPR-associated protein Cas6/Cse3/CasE [Chloroflexales bacterium]
VRRDLGDAHQLHCTVLAAFPQAPVGARARAHFGVLYRAEPIDAAPALVRLLVQSSAPPDWAHLPAEMFGPAPDERGNPAVRGVGEEYARIGVGARLLFRLRANPTKTLSDRTPGRENRLLGKRVALLREEEQLAWLGRKGLQHGFRLLTTELHPEVAAVQVAAQATERGRRPAHDGARTMPLCFGAVLFSGHLEVIDAERFREALAGGIGSGKAFGFGLLSVSSLS